MATRKYRVTVRGTDTVMKLSDADLHAYPDAVPVDDPDQVDADAPTPKARTSSNKARSSTANKAK